MFVLLGPGFEGTQDAYQRLAAATGLVGYDLRARIRPGTWGVVKALADESQALDLAHALEAARFSPVLIERRVAHDPARRILPARGLSLQETGFVLELRDRQMSIEYAALACVVRGEVQPGRTTQRGAGTTGPSSATFRAVAVSDAPLLREASQSPFEAYQAADLHFLSVPWIARLDARAFVSSGAEVNPRALDAVVDALAERARVRVDRGVRTSSVASLAEQSATPWAQTSEPPGVREARREQADERFDPYSRLIGEAERRERGLPVEA
jgi:hypothetical protein